jgi:hypothetical protein
MSHVSFLSNTNLRTFAETNKKGATKSHDDPLYAPAHVAYFPGIRVVNRGYKWPIVGSWKRLGHPTVRFWACCGCTVLHGAALPAKAALETEDMRLYVVFRPTSESRGAACSGRVRLHAMLQCHCQCLPIRPTLAP